MPEPSVSRYRHLLLLLVPLALVGVGTIGYWVLEPAYTLFDALYMTVITLTTVGYEEVHPLGTRGRIFTIVFLLGGMFAFFYAFAELFRMVVSGELQDLWGKQRMARSLAAMNQHLIVCGYGRMGRQVCREFSRGRLAFVVIEKNPSQVQDFNLPHGIVVVGDATSDEVLKRAGVERARALVSVVSSDADNLYITMSARLLNDRLFIVARAEEEEAEQKLLRAGANRVVTPYAIGGTKMAHAVLKPTVVEFIELATQTGHMELQIEETQIRSGSQLTAVSLKTSRLREDLGLIIVAIKKPGGAMIYTPASETILEVGDTLIALGRRNQLDRLEALAGTES
jgi:voltage-gated potassium channel